MFLAHLNSASQSVASVPAAAVPVPVPVPSNPVKNPAEVIRVSAPAVQPAETAVATIEPVRIESIETLRPLQPAVAAGIVVPAEPESESGLKQASAEVYRKSFCDQLKTAGRYNPKAMKRYVIVGIEPGKPVQVTTIDYDGMIRSEVDTIGETEGSLRLIVSEKSLATVGAKLKTDFLKITLTEQLNPETDCVECCVQIQSGESVFSIPADTVDGLPESDRLPGTAVCMVQDWREKPFGATFAQTITAAELLESIRRTEYCVDKESTRYALSGVCIEFSPDSLSFVSTDCRRMAIVENSAGVLGTLPEDFSAVQHVLPSEVVTQLKELVNRIPADSAVCFAFADSEFVIECSAFSIRCKMVEGRLPMFRMIIPRTTAVNIRFERQQLLNAVESAAVVATDESRGIDFRFYSNDSGDLTGISLHCDSPELGKSNVPALCVPSGNVADLVNRKESGEIIDSGEIFTFDHKYITQYLKSTKTERVYLGLNAAGSPAVFTDDSGESAKYLLMPLSRD